MSDCYAFVQQCVTNVSIDIQQQIQITQITKGTLIIWKAALGRKMTIWLTRQLTLQRTVCFPFI